MSSFIAVEVNDNRLKNEEDFNFINFWSFYLNTLLFHYFQIVQ
ncbi:hypothetical protein Tsp_02145 [Trichinella spiralis]|nr:hypothetical protein Tsp_02145 [Trichinella spiralis]